MTLVTCRATRRVGLRLRLLAVTLALAVMAAWGGSSASSPVTGTTPFITGITLSPTATSTAVGSTKQFTATANYSDQSSKDATASAAWSSSDSSVASIQSIGQSNPGRAIGLKAGSVNITASFGGVSAVTTLNVT